MSPKTGDRAVLYLRVSTSRQAGEGHSLDGQMSALTRYVARIGLEAVETVVDGGESGSRSDRPGIKRIMELARAGSIDVLVATKSDRISRSLLDLLKLAEELEGLGVSIATEDGSFDTTTPMSRAMTQVRGTFSELESEMIKQRTREGLAAARDKGVLLGRAPVGWIYVDRKAGQMEPDPEVMPTVLRIHAMSAEGMTLQRIADALNDEGVPTPGSREKLAGTAKMKLSGDAPRWHRATIARALKSPLPETRPRIDPL